VPVINPIPAASPVVTGPCGWTVDTGCIPNWDTYDSAAQTRAIAYATFVLDALTGRQFSQCPVTVRPCGTGCGNPSGYMTWPVSAPASGSPGVWMAPYVLNGVWRNCMCVGGCSCAPECRVDLGVPVAEVTEVKVNGLTLDPAAYQLIGPWLARVDGGECWPACQDPATPDTEDGTFSVTYRPGRPLPVAGQIAAGALAGEFVKACAGAACGLPANVASLTRQGVDVELIPASEVLTEGRTGIREVDLFIQAVNPGNLRSRPRVYSPDVKRHPGVYS
jgi:hypothetical protein